MTADQRKTLEEQMQGMKEKVAYQDLIGKTVAPQRAPEPNCEVPHRNLKTGQRCPTCGFRKI